jgi:hypothetical protein
MQFPTYVVVGFLVPLVYGSWRFTFFHIVTGPTAAYLTTSNPNEWPAVWCLYSVGLVLVAMLGPLRRWFVVRKWIWPASWEGQDRATNLAPGPGRGPDRRPAAQRREERVRVDG